MQIQNYSNFEKLDEPLENRENKLQVKIEKDILEHLNANLRDVFQKLQVMNMTLSEILFHFSLKSFRMNFWTG